MTAVFSESRSSILICQYSKLHLLKYCYTLASRSVNKLTEPESPRLGLQCTNPSMTLLQLTGLLNKTCKDLSTFENTFVTFVVHSTSIIECSTKVNYALQGSPTGSGLENMELVAQVEMKLRRPRRIRFTIDPKQIQSPQDFRFSTNSSAVSATCTPSRIMYYTPPQYSGSLKLTHASHHRFPTFNNY